MVVAVHLRSARRSVPRPRRGRPLGGAGRDRGGGGVQWRRQDESAPSLRRAVDPRRGRVQVLAHDLRVDPAAVRRRFAGGSACWATRPVSTTSSTPTRTSASLCGWRSPTCARSRAPSRGSENTGAVLPTPGEPDLPVSTALKSPIPSTTPTTRNTLRGRRRSDGDAARRSMSVQAPNEDVRCH